MSASLTILREKLKEAHDNYTKQKRGYLRHAPLYALLVEINAKQEKTAAVYFYPHSINVFLYLDQWQSIKDAAPFLEPFAGVEGWTASNRQDTATGSVDYTFVEHKGEPSLERKVNVYVYPHANSQNCERVQVRVEPVYEWRCKEPGEEVEG